MGLSRWVPAFLLLCQVTQLYLVTVQVETLSQELAQSQPEPRSHGLTDPVPSQAFRGLDSQYC